MRMSPSVSSALIRIVVSGESVCVRHCVRCSSVAAIVAGIERQQGKRGRKDGEEEEIKVDCRHDARVLTR